MKTLKLFIRVLLIPVWIIIFFIYLFIWYPAPTPEYPDIKVIKATATEGMKQLIQKL